MMGRITIAGSTRPSLTAVSTPVLAGAVMTPLHMHKIGVELRSARPTSTGCSKGDSLSASASLSESFSSLLWLLSSAVAAEMEEGARDAETASEVAVRVSASVQATSLLASV